MTSISVMPAYCKIRNPMMSNFLLVLALTASFIEQKNAQCDTQFLGHELSYISSNPSSQFVYYLGDQVSSPSECKDVCQNINYLCDGMQKHSCANMDGGSWSSDPDQCTVSISDPGNDGSVVLLTPDIAADEYIIDANLRITSGQEGGLVFGASNPGFPAIWLVIKSGNAIGFGELTSSGYREWDSVGTNDISRNVDYTMRVHKLSTGHWQAYLDGDLVFSSSSPSHKLDSSFPDAYVGVYAWRSDMTFNSLKVSFPSSADEMVCSAYQFNTDSSQCFGYYGTDFAALYDSLSENANFDSGIISPTCPTSTPTKAPTTKAPTTASPTTASPTTASPTTASPTTAAPTTAAPTTASPTTHAPSTKAPTTSAPTTAEATHAHIVSTVQHTTTVKEGIGKEHPDAEVVVSVEKGNTNQQQAVKADKFFDGVLVALSVFFVCFLAFLVVYVWKCRRNDANGSGKQSGRAPRIDNAYRVERPVRNAVELASASGSALQDADCKNVNDEDIGTTSDAVTAGFVAEHIVGLADDEFVVEEEGQCPDTAVVTKGN